jgi:hypothetical protein
MAATVPKKTLAMKKSLDRTKSSVQLTKLTKTPLYRTKSFDQSEDESSDVDKAKKAKWKQKRKTNYYLSKEDIQFLIQNTRYNEPELR